MVDELYTYPNGTLKNKLDIEDSKELAIAEADISFSAIEENIEVFRNLDPISPKSYKEIHKIIFEDIYDWAGEYRKVNITKGDSHFHPCQYLLNAENHIFDGERLKDFDGIINAYAE